jgi:hypothetical protein
MGQQTKISWADSTFNPWFGCRRVSSECEQYYITATPPFRSRGLKHGKERVRARLYCKLPPHRNPPLYVFPSPDYLWIPISIIEGTTKFASKDGQRPQHNVRLPDWFAEEKGL